MMLILPIAGVGARLRPFTFSKPKGFLKIAGSRVVDHILNKIGQNLSLETPLAVIYGYKRAQIRQYLDLNFARQFQITYIDQIPKGYQGDIPYFGGLGHAILLSRIWYEKTSGKSNLQDRLNNPKDVLIFLGDMIPVKDYEYVLDKLAISEIDGVIGTMIVPSDKTQYYGIVEIDSNEWITSMAEKPKQTTSNLAIAGVYAFKEKTMLRLYEILAEQYHKHQESSKSNKNGTHGASEFQFTPALQQLVIEGFKLKIATFQEGILDFGRPDALLEGNRILLTNYKPTVEGTIDEIRDSVLKQPIIIGKNSKLIRSVLGPYVSVGENCVIEDCNLNNVVIGDNSILKSIITSNSIIGDNVKIEKIIKDNIILGDRSFILESDDKPQ